MKRIKRKNKDYEYIISRCDETSSYKDNKVDEIIAKNVNIHIERMDENEWWMGVYFGENLDDRFSIFFGQSGLIVCEAPNPEDQDE